MAETARRNEEQALAAEIAGAALLFDLTGAVYWPDEDTLIVADLHLEKGSSLAGRGLLIPPYDSAATLNTLGRLIASYRPRRVIALGDSFHDGDGPARLDDSSVALLCDLMRGRDWIWLAGNHDADAAAAFGGAIAEEIAIGPLSFRHEPQTGPAPGEVAGHLHPAARMRFNGRSVRRRCFASDGERLIVPAFGAYTGGLNVRDRAFAGLFLQGRLSAFMIGADAVYQIAEDRLIGD